jgi:hypothetical protein
MNRANMRCPACGGTIWLCTGRGERIYTTCAGCEQIMILPVRDRAAYTSADSLGDLFSQTDEQLLGVGSQPDCIQATSVVRD